MIQVDVALNLGAFDLDVAFENGAGITALFGRSGSGKSTTINLIAGLARPDRGTIVLDGRVLVNTEARIFVPAYRRRVGLVFQDAQLFPHLSVRQNLLFGRWFAAKARQPFRLPGWWRRSASITCWSASPRASPAAKSSAWPWAGRCSPRPKFCSWMSRWPRSIPNASLRSCR
jgi:ABC-type branched-subunit amino acid transport system ATPase component